jgi:hypothetical protein
MPFVPLWVTKVILLFAALSLLVALFSLQDTALDSRSERFCAAVEQYRAGLQCLSRGTKISLIWSLRILIGRSGKPQKAVQHYHNTLRLLGKRIPESVPMQIVHLLVHVPLYPFLRILFRRICWNYALISIAVHADYHGCLTRGRLDRAENRLAPEPRPVLLHTRK